jgi:hypothetical protein
MKKKNFNKGMNTLMRKGYSKQKAYNQMSGLALKNKDSSDSVELPKSIQKIILWGLALYLSYALLPTMFELGWITGIGFIVSCGISFYKGKAIENPNLIPVIAIGYILTNTAVSMLLPQIYESIISKSFLVAGIILIVFISLYLRGKELKDMGTK